jgi:hypothetical protein
VKRNWSLEGKKLLQNICELVAVTQQKSFGHPKYPTILRTIPEPNHGFESTLINNNQEIS